MMEHTHLTLSDAFQSLLIGVLAQWTDLRLHIRIFYAIFPICLVYYLSDVLAAKRKIKKYPEYPVVGPWSRFSPQTLLNLAFAGQAVKIVEDGYKRWKNQAYQFVRNDGGVVVLPISVLDELSTLPSHIASPHGALEHDLLGEYTGLNLILESRMHHSIVQRKLTPKLGLLIPVLEEQLAKAMEEYFPPCGNEWIEFQLYQVFGKISARLAARALVGPELCENSTWLDISVNYTENLFRTIVILRLLPCWMRPVMCYLLPSYWKGQQYVRKGKALLSPVFSDLIRKNDSGEWSPTGSVDDSNVLCWLAETAKGKDRNPETLAHVEILLALASVHTTLLRMVNVLYDITSDPGCYAELQAEIDGMHGDWNIDSYANLDKLDSVLRESQRMSPPTTLGMKRLFKQPFTFSNGIYVKKGTYVCLPIYAIENDSMHTANPERFDGLRNYRLRQYAEENKKQEHAFSSPSRTSLNFGYGKTACPGRFFASLIIKMLFVRLLPEYEFRFLPTKSRPQNIMAHEFLFSWPWQKMLVRKRQISN